MRPSSPLVSRIWTFHHGLTTDQPGVDEYSIPHLPCNAHLALLDDPVSKYLTSASVFISFPLCSIEVSRSSIVVRYWG